MSAAARVNPRTYFSRREWARLSHHSSWRGLALVAHCWLMIGAAGAMAVVWPITLPLAVMIIGTRQLGLAILMHDAAHGALHPNLKVNDWVAEWLCSGGVETYRTYHLRHHKYAQQAEDPDLGLSAPFPITRQSLRRKIIRDLTGQTFFKQHFGPLVGKLKARKPGESAWAIIAGEAKRKRRFLIGNGLGLLAMSLASLVYPPLWWAWFGLWLLPLATWYPMVTRLRNIAEHACVAKDEPDPLRHARTTLASVAERLFIAPYYVNYHCEHHMFMHVPCYNLPTVHRMLAKKGVTDGMLVARGYGAVLRIAAPA